MGNSKINKNNMEEENSNFEQIDKNFKDLKKNLHSLDNELNALEAEVKSKELPTTKEKLNKKKNINKTNKDQKSKEIKKTLSIYRKIFLTFFITLVGFGYFWSSVFLTLEIINNHSTPYEYIFLIWLIYLTLLSVPSFYAWDFISYFFKDLDIFSKWIIMFVAIIIPFLYPFFAFFSVWILN